MTSTNRTATTLGMVALSGCLVGLSFVAGLIGAGLGSRIFVKGAGERENITSNIEITDESSAIIDVAESASPAVVSIVITKDLPIYEDWDAWDFFRGEPRSQLGTEETQVGSGSGFIISTDGLIITNRHVVEDAAANYTVVLNDGSQFPATVIDRDTILDIAIIEIEPGYDLPYLQFGDSSALKIGQRVIAIGNSLGEFSNTVSAGIISGLSRSIIAGGNGTTERLEGVIQTDASINPGNSGGPLLDITGKVIGVNVAVAADAENIGFAIPINSIVQIVESVTEFGEIRRPYLGVRYQMITDAEENEYPVTYGARIANDLQLTDGSIQPAIEPGSPAAKAGLKPGDIILEINGQRLDSGNTLQAEIQKYAVGDSIDLKYLRDGEEKVVQIILTERP